jgi:chemotaxis response regulator CheB
MASLSSQHALSDRRPGSAAARDILLEQAGLLDMVREANRQMTDMCGLLAAELASVRDQAVAAHQPLGAVPVPPEVPSQPADDAVRELFFQVSRMPGLLRQIALASNSIGSNLGNASDGIRQAIGRLGAADDIQRPIASPPPAVPGSAENGLRVSGVVQSTSNLHDRVIAIGASTGGVEAIQSLLCGLNRAPLAFVITQHMPPAFMQGFAERLKRATGYDVKVAEDGDLVRPGLALLAPGDRHLVLSGSRSILTCRLDDGPAVNRCKPSVDVMFNSVAQTVGAKAIGVLLTGMGRDGAEGLLAMRNFRALTLCESEKSAVVFGMPKAGLAIGAASDSVPLEAIPGWIMEAAAERPMPPPRTEGSPVAEEQPESGTSDSDTFHFLP